MELKISMTLIPFLDQWEILRTWLQPYMTKVSCISMQSNSVKKRDLLVQGCNVMLQFAPGNPPVLALSRSRWRWQRRVQGSSTATWAPWLLFPALWLWGSARSRTEGTGSYSSSAGRLHVLCKENVCGWWAGTSPCSLRHILRALKGWDQAEVQFCVTEHEGTHASFLPLHPCFGAFMPQTKCLLRCFSLQLLSWVENDLPVWNIWGFSKMSGLQEGWWRMCVHWC